MLIFAVQHGLFHLKLCRNLTNKSENLHKETGLDTVLTGNGGDTLKNRNGYFGELRNGNLVLLLGSTLKNGARVK